MEPCADLKEAAKPAFDHSTALRRFGEPTKDFQKRALAGAIAPDDSNDLPGLDLERDVP